MKSCPSNDSYKIRIFERFLLNGIETQNRMSTSSSKTVVTNFPTTIPSTNSLTSSIASKASLTKVSTTQALLTTVASRTTTQVVSSTTKATSIRVASATTNVTTIATTTKAATSSVAATLVPITSKAIGTTTNAASTTVSSKAISNTIASTTTTLATSSVKAASTSSTAIAVVNSSESSQLAFSTSSMLKSKGTSIGSSTMGSTNSRTNIFNWNSGMSGTTRSITKLATGIASSSTVQSIADSPSGFSFLPASNASIAQVATSGIALIVYAIIVLILLLVGLCLNRKLNKLQSDLKIKVPPKRVTVKKVEATPNIYNIHTTPVVDKKPLPKKPVVTDPVLAGALNDFPSFNRSETKQSGYEESVKDYETRCRGDSNEMKPDSKKAQLYAENEDDRPLTAGEEAVVAALSALPQATLQRALTRNRSNSQAQEPMRNRSNSQAQEPMRNRAMSKAVPVAEISEDLVDSRSRMESFTKQSAMIPRGPLPKTLPAIRDNKMKVVTNEFLRRSAENMNEPDLPPGPNVAVFESPKATMQRSYRNRGTIARDSIAK